MNGDGQGKIANWIQFAILLISLVVLAMHGESRLAKVEQRIDDAERDRVEIIQRLSNLDDKVDRWFSTPHR